MAMAFLAIFFPFLMIYAASSDLVSMTIANRVSILLVVGFFAASAIVGLAPMQVGLHLAVGLGCLVLSFAMFSLGWMGGGDAKLLAATALWFGPSSLLLEYVLLGSLYGGVLTLGLLTLRASLQPVTGIAFVDRLLERETGIPYGIALGAAGLTVYSGSVWMDIATSRLS